MAISQQTRRIIAAQPQGGGIQPPTGFAFIRTVPGTQMFNPPATYAIGPAIAGQGVSA